MKLIEELDLLFQLLGGKKNQMNPSSLQFNFNVFISLVVICGPPEMANLQRAIASNQRG